MLPAEKQQRLVERYGVIEDVQERLAAVMSFGRKLPAWAPEERTDERLVKGCSSRVWLLGQVREGRCVWRLDADSGLIKALAGFLCEIYQGATPEEVAEFEPTLLESLHLTDQLSPTRKNGLQAVRAAVRDFARGACA